MTALTHDWQIVAVQPVHRRRLIWHWLIDAPLALLEARDAGRVLTAQRREEGGRVVLLAKLAGRARVAT